MPKDHPKLVRLRKLIAQLPETSEKLSHGSPTFWGGKKTFASFHLNHHGDGRIAAWVKSSQDMQDMLVESNPETFFVPPYVGPSGWVGVSLEGKVDWAIVEQTLEAGYRMVAPKRAIKQLDDGAE